MKSSFSFSISLKLLFSPYLFAFLAFVIFLSIFHMEDLSYVSSLHDPDPNTLNHTIAYNEKKRQNKLVFAVGDGVRGCDLFSGRWVHDYGWPLYEENECPYIIPQLTCLEHGRPDNDYQHWKWQPNGCSLTSFNATLMLETLRGKRLLFVGDSLNRGQFISMICLLHRVIPQHAKSLEATFDSLSLFTAKDYNATIGFYWAPYLLESNADNPIFHKASGSIVRNGSIDTHGQHWIGADIIVFNTYLWWMTDIKILEGSFDEVKDIVAVPRDYAYRMAMNNLVKWINKNVDYEKTRVFFMTASPTHKSSKSWGGDPNGNCYNETGMNKKVTPWGPGNSIMQIITEEFNKSIVPITVLNITQISNYRKDAHTSIYKAQWRNLTSKQLANPTSYADCIHWCLPGVQDTWNQLLFSKLFYP
ncbi:hypothetical protein RD792_013762 [Penstemon davidsonii]|uniref:Trichome birefringence-like N-terminal domain-containing protein n=1 Tax=Penstemon davidsonii TaxID=160366 RepID=A0ABR0CUD0_9LAMI|nr:hypothetical protein RD792_013762 [Penstemon davidsonii]